MRKLFRMLCLPCVVLGSSAATVPYDMTATAGDAQITLTFRDVAVTSYNVYYDTVPGITKTSANVRSFSNVVAVNSVKTIMLDRVRNGVTYYIKVANVQGDSAGVLSPEISATPAAPTYLYTVNLNGSNISAFAMDSATGSLAPLSGQPFGAPQYASSLAMAGGKFAYAVSPSNQLMAYAVASGTLSAMPGYPVLNGEGSSWVTADPTGRYIYIANAGSAQISAYRIDSSGNPNHIGDYYSGNNPQFVAVDPKGRFVYVANYGENTVAAFTRDTASGALTAVRQANGQTFPAGASPTAMAIDPTGTFLFVANNSGNTISAYTIDQKSGALGSATSYSVGNSPQSIAVDPSGSFVYVTNNGSNNVTAFRITKPSGALQQISGSPFSTGGGPYALAVSPNGKYLYVTNSNDNSISKYTRDLSTGALTNLTAHTAGVGRTPMQLVMSAAPVIPASTGGQAAPQITAFEPYAGGTSLKVTASGLSSTEANNVLTYPGGQTVQASTVFPNGSANFPIPDSATTGPLVLTVGGVASAPSAGRLRMIKDEATCRAAGLTYISKFGSASLCAFPSQAWSDSAQDVTIIAGHGPRGTDTGLKVGSNNVMRPTRAASTITFNGYVLIADNSESIGYLFVSAANGGQQLDSLIVKGELYVEGALQNDGAVRLVSGTGETATLGVSGDGTVNSNTGFVVDSGSVLNIFGANATAFTTAARSPAMFVNKGTVRIDGLGSGLVNAGRMLNDAGGLLQLKNGSGVGITNNQGATLTTAGTISIQNDGGTGISNAGTVTISATGSLANNAGTGAVGVQNTGTVINNGTYSGRAPTPQGCDASGRKCPN